jgi:hypothetical protein
MIDGNETRVPPEFLEAARLPFALRETELAEAREGAPSVRRRAMAQRP